MVVCASTIPLFELIPGFLVIGSAITITGLAWYNSIKSKGLLPKGFKEKKDYLQIFR